MAAASLFSPTIGPLVGVATIHSKEDTFPLTLKIIEEAPRFKMRIFSAYTLIEGEGYALVGELKTTWLRTLPNGKFGSEKEGPIYGAYANYGSAEKTNKVSKIYLKLLHSFENEIYTGIGTALMQVAIETSFYLGCEGRLILDAVFNSHPFWYKMGMRSLYDSEKDELVLHEIAQGKKERRAPRTDELNVTSLYLPPEAIALWKQRIDKAPVLFDTINKMDLGRAR